MNDLLQDLLGTSHLELHQIRAGKNSQVYLVVESTGHRQWIAKRYFRSSVDQRDRLSIEYGAFEYLTRHGVSCVPKPISKDVIKGIAIYEYISGERALDQTIVREDIDQAVDFLVELKHFSSRDDHQFINASEAYFSPADVLCHVQERRKRFEQVNLQGKVVDEFWAYLNGAFDPFLVLLSVWLEDECLDNRVDFQKPLTQEYRTLSPSDFGYHNAVRRQDGSIAFVDFEYFGWDDPAKMVCDFLWHPAMSLNEDLKKYFWGKMLFQFPHMADLESRVRLMYPLFGMKWCLIFLNEFLPRDQARKEFLNVDQDREIVLKQQLQKACSFLEIIQGQYKEWPYGCKIQR